MAYEMTKIDCDSWKVDTWVKPHGSPKAERNYLMKSHKKAALLIRKVSGSNDIEKALRQATQVLGEHHIPSLVVGGFAVQEHGYPRFTADVDIIVANVQQAREWLSINGFKENPGSTRTVTHRETKVEVDLLPGGGSVGPGPLKLPMPTQVSTTPEIADLRTLIEIKLSSYLGSPGRRLKDAADVVELIRANDLPREWTVAQPVQAAYDKLWDGLHSDAS